MMKTKLLLSIITLIFVRCTNPTEHSTPYVSNETFPLSLGNIWFYEEMHISADTTFSRKYSEKVIDIIDSVGYTWSVINWNNSYYNYLLTAKNDSIYELQNGGDYPVVALTYIFPEDSVTTFQSLLGGDVGLKVTVHKLDTIITNKAGSFSNCYRFDTSNLTVKSYIIISKGIGVIEKYSSVYIIQTGDVAEIITKLEKYSIQ